MTVLQYNINGGSTNIVLPLLFFSDGCTFVVVRDVEVVACFSFICSKIIFL